MQDDGPINSVPKLLAPHDREFIYKAYQAVLGREPDTEGEGYYLARLRAGTHKLSLLKQLRRSPEGRNFVPGVAGLDRAIKRHSWATLPLIGLLVRLVSGTEGNSITHRHLRILANEVGKIRNEQGKLAHMVEQVAKHAEVIAAMAPSERLAQSSATEEAGAPRMPRLDVGDMPESLDSAERSLLAAVRRFALTRGAPA